MAITRTETKLTWSAANTVTVASAGNATSDEVTFNSAVVGASLTLKADFSGTPGSGDTVDFYLLLTAGDPDGTGADEYATPGHGDWIGRIDTNIDDPGVLTVEIRVAALGFELYCINNGSANMTVGAVMTDVRS